MVSQGSVCFKCPPFVPNTDGLLVCRSFQLQHLSLQLTRDLCFKHWRLCFAPRCAVGVAPWVGSILGRLPPTLHHTRSLQLQGTLWPCQRGLLSRKTALWGAGREERMRSQVWNIQPLTSRGASLGCNSFRIPKNTCPLTEPDHPPDG